MATKKASTKSANTKSAKTTTKIVKTSSVAPARATTTKRSDLIMNAPIGALFAELIGTFLLAAVVITTSGQPIFVLFALTAIVLTIGHLSGAHVNPAITFGAWVTRKIETKRAIGYIIFQFIGAILAYLVLTALLGGSPAQQNPLTGQPQAAELFKATQIIEGKEWYAFFASVLGLSVFGFAVASALRERKEHMAAAFTVGGGLFLALIIAGAASILNPAIAVSLQAFTELKGSSALPWALAIHIGAPLIGAAIGFLLYDLFRRDVDTVA